MGEKIMEINYFTEFITLAKIGNFTEAAEELGELLFHRTTKKLELTEYGQILLEDAQKISELQAHYTEQLDDYKRNRPQVLRLGSIHMMTHYGITNLLSGFSQSFPRIHLEIFNN